MTLIFGIFIFLFGITIGSFLNVCIYRIPEGKSIAYPPSHCPKCSTALKPLDLIPIFSFVLHRGKCRYCGAAISLQYPLIELLNGILYVLLFIRFGPALETIKYSLLTSLMIIIFVIDLKTREIPDGLIIFTLLAGFFFNILHDYRASLINGAIGLLIGGGIFLLISVVSGGNMGGGDIKLMGVLGFWLGWKQILLLSLLSFVIGAAACLLLIAIKIKKKKDPIAFGPFITVAAVVTIFFGTQLIDWYYMYFLLG